MLEEIKTYEIDDIKLKSLQYAIIQTNKGDIIVKLFADVAPQTVINFATLSMEEFYKNLSFHRVIPGFVAQGGCPKGDGTGGPGYRIRCEIKNNPHKHLRGSLSMAHAGRDTGGSQFFICFASQPHLNGEHTVFGKIEDTDHVSLKVLDSLQQGDIIKNILINANR